MPRLGKASLSPMLCREQRKQEWLESGERSEIERDFGVGKQPLLTGMHHNKTAAHQRGRGTRGRDDHAFTKGGAIRWAAAPATERPWTASPPAKYTI